MEAGRLAATPQATVNITEDALWNLMSACSNTGILYGFVNHRDALCMYIGCISSGSAVCCLCQWQYALPTIVLLLLRGWCTSVCGGCNALNFNSKGVRLIQQRSGAIATKHLFQECVIDAKALNPNQPQNYYVSTPLHMCYVPKNTLRCALQVV